MIRIVILFCALAAMLSSCGDSPAADGPAPPVEPSDLMLDGLTTVQKIQHAIGDDLFSKTFREEDGIGPVFIQDSCELCHWNDSRGPGTVTRMVIMNPDGATRASDQSSLPYGSVVRPRFLQSRLHEGVNVPVGVPNLKTSVRVGPSVFGRGWMEAVDPSEIERQAQLQERHPEEHGRIPRLPDGRLGRFGLKARIATLDEFAADAFNGDMGLTSDLFLLEPGQPREQRDDALPGLDITAGIIRDVGFYVRTLKIPERTGVVKVQAKRLFEDTRCAICHVPQMKTRPDFPVARLANKDALIYSDMLLHDMGTSLADGIVEGGAREREWRTAPLIGLRMQNNLFLHDGRATTIRDAILKHSGPGSEANASIEIYKKLSAADKDLLDSFVMGL